VKLASGGISRLKMLRAMAIVEGTEAADWAFPVGRAGISDRLASAMVPDMHAGCAARNRRGGRSSPDRMKSTAETGPMCGNAQTAVRDGLQWRQAMRFEPIPQR
jgi:hypothetical protein